MSIAAMYGTEPKTGLLHRVDSHVFSVGVSFVTVRQSS